MDTLLRVKNLSVSFDSQKLLDNLNFTLRRGEMLAVIGPNGAGKTVLLKTLLGMFPHEGEISWSKEVTIGYVPQKIEADRHLPLNLKNLLAAKAEVLGLKNFSIKKLAEEVGLNEAALNTPIGHLSGGQFQRALIAFALLGDPAVLILDEPTASIDKPGEEKMYGLVRRLRDAHGLTVIMVSHELSVIYNYATQVLCLNIHGICFGEPEKVLSPETLGQVYGEHKYFHHYYHKEKE